MPVSSNALPTPSSCCDANGPNWKTRQLLVMVPGWWPYMLRWKQRKEIWTNSMHAGRNSERRQPICRIPALDEVLAQSLPYYPYYRYSSGTSSGTSCVRTSPFASIPGVFYSCYSTENLFGLAHRSRRLLPGYLHFEIHQPSAAGPRSDCRQLGT